MSDVAVEIVRPERAALAPLSPVRTEHEVIDDQLAAALEEIGQSLLAAGDVEDIVLLHSDPRQLPALPAQLVTQPRELFLLDEMLLVRCEPFVARDYGVGFHRLVSLVQATAFSSRARHPIQPC